MMTVTKSHCGYTGNTFVFTTTQLPTHSSSPLISDDACILASLFITLKSDDQSYNYATITDAHSPVWARNHYSALLLKRPSN